MKTALIVGANSHIYNGIRDMMEADGWSLEHYPDVRAEWDVFISFIGQVSPVGLWHDLPSDLVAECIESNLLEPLRILKNCWPHRKANATVLLFAGSNPQRIMDGYMPYNVGKMALIKAVEQLDHETPDAKFIAFGPGYVRDSPIHSATKKAAWPNERIARGDAGTPMEKIWEAMKFCIEQPKESVGGRNLAVSDICQQDGKLSPLVHDSENAFRLRRIQ